MTRTEGLFPVGQHALIDTDGLIEAAGRPARGGEEVANGGSLGMSRPERLLGGTGHRSPVGDCRARQPIGVQAPSGIQQRWVAFR